ncbi:LptA/OstA family protein [Spirochaetia bacterium 38H-sp]|uniref:LptA/OstA family protein n=1 Tax=Rarispira pelagica TaxID=3141764 RepID=A0ABU9UAX1_9SPIR
MKRTSLITVFILTTSTLIFAEDFFFSADNLEATLAKGKEKTILSGNAIVNAGSKKMTADKIELSGTDFRYVRCIGNVRFSDSEDGILIQAQQLFFDRDKELSHIEGNIILEDKKNNTVIKAEIIDYDQKNKQAFIQINVRLFKEDITGRSEFAKYNRDKKILTLSGSPILYKGEDKYSAERVIVDLETKDVTMEGKIEGQIIQKKKSENTSQGEN